MNKGVAVILQNSYIEVDRRVRREVELLLEMGCAVAVVCPLPPQGKREEAIAGVRFFRYPQPPESRNSLSYVREYAYSLWHTYRLLRRATKEMQIDAIHVCNPPDIFFMFKAFWGDIKFIYDQHDPAPEVYLSRFRHPFMPIYAVLRLCEWITYRAADVVLVTNGSAKATAIKRGALTEERVYVVRNGPFLYPQQCYEPDLKVKNGHRYMVCCMGAISEQDGVQYFVEAARHLVNVRGRKDIWFAVIGSGSALDRLKRMVSDYGIGEHVGFTGFIQDRETLAKYLQAADVCVSPEPKTRCNDMSTFIKVLDYMAFGKPIVAFDLKETRVSAAESAVYATPNETSELAQKIEELLANEVSRIAMDKLGRERIASGLDWKHSKEALRMAYSQVLNASKEKNSRVNVGVSANNH